MAWVITCGRTLAATSVALAIAYNRVLLQRWRRFDSVRERLINRERAPRPPLQAWPFAAGANVRIPIAVLAVVTTPRRFDAVRGPASSGGRCRPSAAPRVRSANGWRDSGRPQRECAGPHRCRPSRRIAGQHLVGMKAHVFPQHCMRERGDQRLRRMATPEVAGAALFRG
jgi:hypothetical protein